MGLLDSVMAAATGVGQKVTGNVDLMGINSQIAASEKEINELFTKLGAAYFAAHRNNPEDAFKAIVEDLKGKEEHLKDLRSQQEAKRAENAAVTFTTPPTPAQSVGMPANNAAPATVVCPVCGATGQTGSFCAACGSKLHP